MSAASDRRNARARAEGWSSYSQKYRAERAGYAGKAPEYQAAVDARTADGIVKRAASGKLLGGAQTRAGTVISADVRDPAQARQLLRELGRFGEARRVRVTIETTTGDVVNVGTKGGMSPSYLLGLAGRDPRDMDDGEDWADGWDDVADLVDDNYGGGASGSAAIVTVVIA